MCVWCVCARLYTRFFGNAWCAGCRRRRRSTNFGAPTKTTAANCRRVRLRMGVLAARTVVLLACSSNNPISSHAHMRTSSLSLSLTMHRNEFNNINKIITRQAIRTEYRIAFPCSSTTCRAAYSSASTTTPPGVYRLFVVHEYVRVRVHVRVCVCVCVVCCGERGREGDRVCMTLRCTLIKTEGPDLPAFH